MPSAKLRRWLVTDVSGFEHVVEFDAASVGSFYCATGFWGLSPNLPEPLGPYMYKHGSGAVQGFTFVELL